MTFSMNELVRNLQDKLLNAIIVSTANLKVLKNESKYDRKITK